ncbi:MULTISPECIES: hypothetical protein [unclassified Fusobacterium]|uniref:hypothetical protein n=1 Tax=unclassified Fusobacterium TaxID=2648384 RepID=UPI0025B8049D|nr:hypothetical protein [Fusobacterium sp.]
MTINMERMKRNTLLLIISGILVMITQRVGLGTPMIDTVPGIILIILVALVALVIREMFPKSVFPAFGWVTILGFILSMPQNPMSAKFMEYVGKVDFISITTPLLTFAGISVGNKIDELKRMSWKIVLISVVVFITIFFACALIAQTVLRITGDI